MPVLGVVFFLIGVDWRQVSAMLALVSALAFSCGMGGILCSTLFRKTIVAMIASYFVALCLTGAPLLVFAFMSSLFGRGFFFSARYADRLIQLVSPVVAIVQAVSGGLFGRSTLSVMLPILYQVGWGLAFFAIARWVMSWAPKPPKVELRKPIDDQHVLERRRKRFPYYLIDPLRRKKPIEDQRNPMLAKELRWGFLGRADWLIRIFYGALIIYMFSAVNCATNMGRSGGSTVSFIVLQLVVTALVIPPLLANSLAKEYEMGNIDFLRSTLLTPSEIVLGKVFAGLINLSPLLLASACVGACMLGGALLWYPREVGYLVAGYGSLAACVILSLGIGMFSALSTKRTSTSLVMGYGISIMAYFGVALLVMLLGMWLDSSLMRGSEFERLIGFLSPISAYLISPSVSPSFVRRSGFGAPGPLNMYWFSNVVFFSLIGVGFLARALYQFRTHGMKDR